jgi:dihydropteroate synthase
MEASAERRIWRCGRHVLDLRRPLVMGILNVTPDSFSDGGLYADRGKAIEHGMAMARAGADIIDVGGESTRPGALDVAAAEEISRVCTVIGALALDLDIPLSVDTRHAGVAEAAVIGDRRKFPMVIFAPQFPALEKWATEAGIATLERQALVADSRVQALYHGIVSDANQKLARFEKIKKVLVVADEFTIANGILTPSMKLKRRVIEERYGDLINQVYATPVDSAAA